MKRTSIDRESAMTTLHAGSRVERGHYFNLRTWTLHAVERSGERLPGGPGDRYVAIPTLAALALAPVLGALLIVFLPVAGVYLTLVALSAPLARVARRIATGLAATVQPGWAPGHAHLTGQAAAAALPEPGRRDEDPLDELERTIATLRRARSAAR